MYNNVFYKPAKKIKVSATDFIMSRKQYQPEQLLQLFLEESKRCYYTSMCFPSRVASVREQQAQKQTYDYFVHTMAEMIKKYAPEVTEQKGRG